MSPLRITPSGRTASHRFREVILSQMRVVALMLAILFGCVGAAQAATDFSDYSGFASASSTTVSTIKIGALTDSETAITADTSAKGDDITGSDDEDGVSLPASVRQGASSSLTVNVTNSSGSTVYLNVWIDFNGNGVLTDSGEQIAINKLVSNGASNSNQIVTFTVPATASIDFVGVRVRLTSTSGAISTGLVGNGEVEDYIMNISTPFITALSNEILANTTTAGDQLDYVWSVRSVAVQPNGSFIVVWIDKGGADGQAKGIFGQRFDASGNRLGTEFLVNTTTSGSQDNNTLAVAPDGSFIVGWDGPGSSTDAYAQRFTPEGVKNGGEFLLNTSLNGSQQYPELCYFSDGTFIAAFVDSSQTVLQRFDTQARKIGQETRISSAVGNVIMDSICTRPDNTVLLTWTEADDVYGQIFTSSLAPIGTPQRLNQYTTGIQEYSGARIDERGNSVVVWQSKDQDGSGMGVYGRRYDSNLNPLGNEFVLTTSTIGNQYEPQVAVSPSGSFFVAWTDYDNNRDGGGGTPSSSCWMRQYDATGTALGSEIMVNQSTIGYQGFPVIAVNASGRLAVMWEGNGTQTGQIDSYGVFCRIYQMAQTGTNVMSVTPTTGHAGDLVTVTMTLTAPTSTANVVPNPLSASGTNGVFAELVSGPSIASATVGLSGTSFTWIYRLTTRSRTGTLTFGGDADDNGSAIFPFAETGQVTVSPSLFIRDVTAPNIACDSNVKTSPGAGPKVFTIGVRVTNPGLNDLADVVINLGDGTTPAVFPQTTMQLWQTKNTYQGTFGLRLLADNSDATRTLFKLGGAKNVIAGGIDFNGNGSVGAEDSGTLSNGMKVIGGRIDVNGDSLINTSDKKPRPLGTFEGYVEPAVIDGFVDISGDGVITAADADTFGGETTMAYWQVAYDTVDAANNPTFGNATDIGDDLRYDWTVWGRGTETGYTRTAQSSDFTNVRTEIGSSANKVSPNPGGFISGGPPRTLAGKVDINSDGSITTADNGTYYGMTIIAGGVDIDKSGTITTADNGTLNGFNVIGGSIDASENGSIGSEDDMVMVQIGQTFSVTANNATFGTVGAGYDANRDGLSDFDMWYQPVGDTGWNANSFRLVDIQADITGTGGSNPLSGITTHFSNEPYLSRLIGDVSGGFNANYTYTWVVVSKGSTSLTPYHQASSGSNNIKYSGDYGISVKTTTGPTAATSGISLTKSGGPNPTLVADATTWTMGYQNTSSTPMGSPSSGDAVLIEDAIPANTTFVASSATSTIYPTIIQYSTDGGTTWTSTEPPAASVTRLRWLVDTVIPVSGSGSVSFQTTVNNGTATQTNIPNQAIVKIGTGPTIATATASVTAVGIDYGDMSMFGPASSISHPTMRIGALIDEETFATTNATATGDDLTGIDDEDGVTVPASVVLGTASSLTVNVTNTSGAAANLNVWIDFNRNGVLTDAGEQVAVNTSIITGTSNSNRTVNFTVPANASPGAAGIRVRLTSTATPGATGASGNGEVEDWTLNQVCPVLTLSPATVTAGKVGTAYSQTFTTASGVSPYSYAVTSGTLPAGLTLTSAGVLSGTPTASNGAGTSITLTATDAVGCTVSTTYNFKICPVISLSPSSLPNGMVNSAYSQTITASGGATPYVFTAASGSLPAGLSLNTSTGVISGRPTATTAASFTLSATDANGCAGTQAYTVTPASPTDMGDFASFGSASSIVLATLKIGALTDAEITATTNATATGDDVTDLDDEDGLTVPASVNLGVAGSLTVNVTNTSGASAFLNVWIDFNRNGVLTDSGEQVAANTAVATGTSNSNRTINFTVPATASAGIAGVRVRLTSTSTPGATGASGNGEIEDTVMTLVCPAVTLLPATLPTPTVGTVYSQTITASGGVAPYSYTLDSGSLPSWATLSSAGVLSGTPNSTTAATFSVRATDANVCVGTLSYTITPVCPAITIAQSSLPQGTVGSAYSQTLSASGGTAPYGTWTITTGTLPTGLTLNASTGVISGTPTAAVSPATSITVRVNDTYGCQGTQSITLQICPVVTLAPATPATGTVGTAYSQTITASGGASPYTFVLSSGTLPTGLTLNSITGVVSGTPSTQISSNVTLRATDANGCQGTLAATFAMSCPPITITPATLPRATVGSPYSQTLTASGGIASYTWAVTSGTLPAGLTLNATTGVLSGTPTTSNATGTSITITTTDSFNCPGTRTYTLQVCPVVTVSPATLATPTVGTAYSQTITAGGGASPYTYALASGTLPTWATLSASGVLSGTPNSITAANFVVSVTDANGCLGTLTYNVTPVCPAISVTPASIPSGVVGFAYSQTMVATGGTAPRTFAISSGTLPAGISLDPNTGVLSGVPTSTATASFVLKVTDANACYGTGAYTLKPDPGYDYGDYSLFGSASSMGYTTVRMGASIDKETVLVSNSSATGDDINGIDDEDGVTVPASATVGNTNTLIVNVTNTNGTSAYLNAWIDFNHNGILTDPGEQVTSNQTVANGVASINRYLSFVVPSNAYLGDVGVRVRITSTANPGPTGLSGNGEVEDNLMTIVAASDYGDHASLGIASSTPITSLLMGSTVDAELAAVTNAAATGDDITGTDDEDGVTIPAALQQGTAQVITVNVTNTMALTGFLNVWVDWNNNGVLTDAGEQVAANLTVTPGTIATDYAINFTVPSNIAPGVVPVRVRLTNTSTTLSVGDSGNGEVEDCVATIVCANVVLSPAMLPAAVQGEAYNQALTAAGAASPITYAMTSGSLPAGLSFNTATGVISGTPTASNGSGTSITIQATGLYGCQGSGTYTVQVCPVVALSPATLLTPTVGTAYSQTITVSGGTAAYTYALASGALPSWATLSSAGVLSGTPNSTTSATFTVRSTDANGCSGTLAYTITPVCPTITITQSSLQRGTVGTAYSQTLTASGGVAPYSSWAITTGTLPAGLTLNASTGVISGTPTATTSPATSTTFRVSDANGCQGSRAITLQVCPVVTLSPATLLTPTVGTAYSQTISASGGTAPYTYTVSSGALPAWATLSSTGVLSGAPNSTTAATFTVRVTDANGCFGTQFYNMGSAPASLGIGNLVFVDDNGNSRFDLGEGSDGVTIELYRWGDTPGAAQPVATTVTADGGNYQFSNLWQGQYFLHLPAYQFESSGNLRGLFSIPVITPGDDNVGQDALATDTPWTSGVRTGIINLVSNDEPTNADTETGFNYTSDDADDANTDLTVDIGLFRPVALGNMVFGDNNSNGHYDTGEGISGVSVQLYTDTQFPEVDNPLAVTTTDAVGRYGFSFLRPGNYVVHIPSTQFQTGGPLFQRISILEGLVGDDDVGQDGIANGPPTNNGVSSLLISLYPGNAPTDDSGETGFEHTSDDQNDAAIDLTIDFGFQTPVGVGNLVFIDASQNGKADVGEGADGVTVELYRSSQIPGFGVPLFSRITSNGGQYFFDALPAGSYILHIPYTEFEPGRPLSGLVSVAGVNSIGAALDDNLTNNDNGIDNASPFLNGISSAAFNLVVDTEPTDANGETGMFKTMDAFDDNNFDLTIDFGFAPNNPNDVGVGNLVFVDLNGNGEYDAGEGIDGVKVQLFDAAADVHVAYPISTVISNNGGSYLFSKLVEGDYKIFIPASEFAAGKPLSGWRSLAGDGGDYGVDDNADENGVDVADPATTGVVSASFHLSPGDEPTNSFGEYGYNAFMDDVNDANTDLTIDFGFFRSVAVGNLVFVDANYNGRADAGEGVGGVTLEIYQEGAFIPFDAPVTTTTTTSDGSYLFSDLTPGRYFVRVPAWQFDFGSPLYGYASVLASQSGDDNVGEDGIDEGNPSFKGIQTAVIELSLTNAPTGSQEGGYQGSSDNVNDASTNLTIDFGFVPRIGVGNVIFNDANNDGIFDPGVEYGMDGVTVEIWNSQPKTADVLVGATTTNGGGLYNFSVAPGSYYVRTPESNFQSGGALANLVSSAPVGAGTAVPTSTAGDDDTEQDGYTSSSVLVDGARTAIFTLAPGNEPIVTTTETGYDSESDDFDDTNVNLTIDFGFLAGAGSPNAVVVKRNLVANPDTVSAPATFTAWQSQNSLNGLNSPNDDPDADGQTNLLEYALGTAGGSGLGVSRFTLVSNTVTGAIDAMLTRPAGSHADLRYYLEGSNDLSTWTTLALTPVTAANQGGTETLRYSQVESAFSGAVRGYLRIKVALDANLDGTPEATAATGAQGWARMQFQVGRESLSMPLLLPAVYTGQVATVSGRTVMLNLNSVDIRTQLQNGVSYYMEVLSGALTGRTFDLDTMASASSSIALTTSADGALAGARISIRPNWTLGALLPVSSLQSAAAADTADRVMFFDSASGQFQVDWLQTSSGAAQWVKDGDTSLSNDAARIIPPQVGMLVQVRSTPATLTFLGEVRSAALALPQTVGNTLLHTGLTTARLLVRCPSRWALACVYGAATPILPWRSIKTTCSIRSPSGWMKPPVWR